MRPLSGVKIWGWRQSLVGDMVTALPLLTWAEKQWPGSFKYWQTARKVSQAVPLLYNHALINEIVISDCHEGMGPRDEAIASSCHVRVNTMPQHPDGDVWPTLRGVYAETARMAGLSDAQYDELTEEERWPHLAQWFASERRTKAIAIWPGARQGEKENRRNPPYEWWAALCARLKAEGYTVYQCGHPNDLKDRPLLGIDARQSSFMDLIALSLGCDLAIGTDSGSMIAVAAYHSTPTLSLLSPHWPGHTGDVNPLAFGPLGKRHVNLWAPSNTAHSVDKVVDTVRQLG